MNIVGSILNIAKEVVSIEVNENILIRELRHKFEEDVHDALSDNPVELQNVWWTWDKGQEGGMTDPSWDPYVDEIGWNKPVKKVLEWSFFAKNLEGMEVDAIVFYNKVLHSSFFRSIEFRDIDFDFDKLGVHYCKTKLIRAVALPNGIELTFDDIVPPEGRLEEEAAEHDKDKGI